MAAVDVAEAVAGSERGSAAGDDDVFGERRAIGDAEAVIFTDTVADASLQENELQRLGAIKTKIVEVGKRAKFGSEIEIGASVGEKNSRVDEIGLTFLFIRTERWKQAARRS